MLLDHQRYLVAGVGEVEDKVVVVVVLSSVVLGMVQGMDLEVVKGMVE